MGLYIAKALWSLSLGYSCYEIFERDPSKYEQNYLNYNK